MENNFKNFINFIEASHEVFSTYLNKSTITSKLNDIYIDNFEKNKEENCE
ncbi:hypothetical protein [Pseudobacteroides cellulosolvens]|uniref:Uncharacterized protein n=1 Tax=Pseudobacteroides cellulosolvens ATCC 35603 = DSM 2933 TaxID=398512 RepID=A0A0L6JGJ1_9FIRM|nr:hypothetical protein [Pseudobacteroides cellulosolvens]KNY24986.1 hypothetical protein Bccel_0243 [Pseudobacteroides cellulosolvens ATCC 35603 = DSM 2933]